MNIQYPEVDYMKIYWTKVTEVIQESSDIYTYMLESPEEFSWEEGSFTHFALEGFNDEEKPNRGLVRHMSICTLPKEGKIGITTRIKEQASEFKETLREVKPGDKVALFRTFCNVPLRRENKTIYLLSQGVGIATFRPLVLEYLNNSSDITHIHSINIDSSNEFLFSDIFSPDQNKNFTSEFINNRPDYYTRIEEVASDQDALYYIVGSDEFIKQNIHILLEKNISEEQIMLDKRADLLPEFLPNLQTQA